MVDVGPRTRKTVSPRIQAFLSQQPEGFDSLQAVAEDIASTSRTASAEKPGRLGKNVRLGADGKFDGIGTRFRTGRLDLVKRQLRLEACARNLKLPRCSCAAACRMFSPNAAFASFCSCVRTASTFNVPDAATWCRRPQRHFRKRGHCVSVRAVPVDGTQAQPSRELRLTTKDPRERCRTSLTLAGVDLPLFGFMLASRATFVNLRDRCASVRAAARACCPSDRGPRAGASLDHLRVADDLVDPLLSRSTIGRGVPAGAIHAEPYLHGVARQRSRLGNGGKLRASPRARRPRKGDGVAACRCDSAAAAS